jgi:hypothetical protein
VYHQSSTKLTKVPTSLVWVLTFILLILSGVGYRVLVSRLQLIVSTPIALPVSLSAFPTEIDTWIGKDVPISENIQGVAGNDDFINRLYISKSKNQWVNVYISYSGHPRTMLGHSPQVCYPASGWVHDNTKRAEFGLSSGKHVPCLIHRFHMPAPNYEERVVLNFYIVNGQTTADENVFSSVGWRTPNIRGVPARYVAQVQISSILENSVRLAARNLTDKILGFFPDENGKVKAMEYTASRNVF